MRALDACLSNGPFHQYPKLLSVFSTFMWKILDAKNCEYKVNSCHPRH